MDDREHAPLTAAELSYATSLLREMPSDDDPGDDVYHFTICPKCHMGFNVPNHIQRCDGTRPFANDLICDGPHSVELAEESYRRFVEDLNEP